MSRPLIDYLTWTDLAKLAQTTRNSPGHDILALRSLYKLDLAAHIPTQKALTTWTLLTRWILGGLRETSHSYRHLCRRYSRNIWPTLLLDSVPVFLAPVQFTSHLARTTSLSRIDDILHCCDSLNLVWRILPALQHYAFRFKVALRAPDDSKRFLLTPYMNTLSRDESCLFKPQASPEQVNLVARLPFFHCIFETVRGNCQVTLSMPFLFFGPLVLESLLF